MTKTFINGEGLSKYNASTIGMLYTYWHELAKDGITHPTIDEQKEIEELVSLLPKNIVLTQIQLQKIGTEKYAYTYVFKRSCTTNFPSKALSEAITKIDAFLYAVNVYTEKAGYFYTTPVHGTNLVIGTVIYLNNH